MMVNREQYLDLIRNYKQSLRSYKKEDGFKFLEDADFQEINLWTYWQGREAKDVDIMVVGQDWGNIDKSSNNLPEMLKGNYFPNGAIYATDRNLITLLDSIDYPCKERNNKLFFTNFYLKYRTGNMPDTGVMCRSRMMNDAKNFKKLVDAIQPKVIICLGQMTFECAVSAIREDGKFYKAAKNIAEYCNNLDHLDNLNSNKNFVKYGEIGLFGVIHCGSFGVNINRRRISSNPADLKPEDGLILMKKDFENIKKYLDKI